MSGTPAQKRTIYLSRSERRTGAGLIIRFSGFNGLGISFIGDAGVSLLALHFGAGNTEMGILSAMIHISGIALLVVPRLFRNRNVVTVGFWAWMMRGFICLPYGTLLFLQGKTAVAVILATYAMFCLSRTAGVAMVNTIQKHLMVGRTQNDLVFRNATSFQGTQIMARLISYVILSLKTIAELIGLLILPALGLIFNTAAALTLRAIPNRTRVDYRRGRNLFVIWMKSIRTPKTRRVLMLRWISLGQDILFAMALPFLRNSVGIEPARIFLYTIALSMAAFLSSLSIRPIAARAGSRPVLFFAAWPAALFFVVWTFIPAVHHTAVYIMLGFSTMFFLNAASLAANRLLVDVTPESEAVGFNSMETFATSILALILGLGAGFLADLSNRMSVHIPVNSYGLTFLPAALGSAAQIALILKIEEQGSLKLSEAARMLTNMENLRVWQTLSSLEATADPVKRKTLIHSMGHNRAPAAASEIRKILAEPLSMEKGDLINALFHTRRPELAGLLHAEAADPAAFYRDRAVFALGCYPGEDTEHILRDILDDPDDRMRAAAAKSLGRIGARSYLPQVQEAWSRSRGIHEKLDYMIALFHMDSSRRYLRDIFSPWGTRSGERMERTMLTLVSRQFGMVPSLGYLYREESFKTGKGLSLLLEESRDTSFLLEQGEELEQLWSDSGYSDIWTLCLNALEDVSPPEELIPVIHALRRFEPEDADSANALAALFFTYQILTSEAEL